MTYVNFDTHTQTVTLDYNLFSSSNIVLGAASNMYGSRLYMRGGGVVVEELNGRDRDVFVRLVSSNIHDVMIGVYSTSNNSNAFVGTGLGTDLAFGTRGIEAMRIMAGGNIGIGTTVAREGMEVRRGVLFSGPGGVVFDGSGGVSMRGSNVGEGGVVMEVLNGSNVVSMRCLRAGNIEVFPSGGSGRGLVLGSTRALGGGVQLDVGRDVVVGGNVGIGTTFPMQKLHIEGNLFMTGAVLQNTANRAIFSHRNTSVGGGSLQANQYVTRIVNTVEYNDITGVVLSTPSAGNTVFQLPAGIYNVRVDALAFNCGYTRLGLYNETLGVWTYGMSQFANTGDQVTVVLDTILTPASVTLYTIRHFAQTTVLNNGMGIFNAAAPGYATYMTVHINKIK
jgi:hypothetical protein